MIDVTNLTKKTKPGIDFKKIKDEILGKKYSLSLVFCGPSRLRTLNKKFRKKDKPANTLSFNFEKNEGEIFLNTNNKKNKIIHLYIHSLLHLKGHTHGSKMDNIEKKLLNKFLN